MQSYDGSKSLGLFKTSDTPLPKIWKKKNTIWALTGTFKYSVFTGKQYI